jgi:hypothetical protein
MINDEDYERAMINVRANRLAAAMAPVLADHASPGHVRLIIDAYPDAFYDVPQARRATMTPTEALEHAQRISLLLKAPAVE